MSEQLKPCPMCDTRSLIGRKESWGNTPIYYVQCEMCGGKGRRGYSIEEANAHWNTRPLEDALQAKVDALVELMRTKEKTMPMRSDYGCEADLQAAFDIADALAKCRALGVEV